MVSVTRSTKLHLVAANCTSLEANQLEQPQPNRLPRPRWPVRLIAARRPLTALLFSPLTGFYQDLSRRSYQAKNTIRRWPGEPVKLTISEHPNTFRFFPGISGCLEASKSVLRTFPRLTANSYQLRASPFPAISGCPGRRAPAECRSLNARGQPEPCHRKEDPLRHTRPVG
jgi:hypothetical protein